MCVSRSKYNSTFTHELCILCGRHYLCGDVVPLRLPVPAEGKNIILYPTYCTYYWIYGTQIKYQYQYQYQ